MNTLRYRLAKAARRYISNVPSGGPKPGPKEPLKPHEQHHPSPPHKHDGPAPPPPHHEHPHPPKHHEHPAPPKPHEHDHPRHDGPPPPPDHKPPPHPPHHDGPPPPPPHKPPHKPHHPSPPSEPHHKPPPPPPPPHHKDHEHNKSVSPIMALFNFPSIGIVSNTSILGTLTRSSTPFHPSYNTTRTLSTSLPLPSTASSPLAPAAAYPKHDILQSSISPHKGISSRPILSNGTLIPSTSSASTSQGTINDLVYLHDMTHQRRAPYIASTVANPQRYQIGNLIDSNMGTNTTTTLQVAQNGHYVALSPSLISPQSAAPLASNLTQSPYLASSLVYQSVPSGVRSAESTLRSAHTPIKSAPSRYGGDGRRGGIRTSHHNLESSITTTFSRSMSINTHPLQSKRLDHPEIPALIVDHRVARNGPRLYHQTGEPHVNNLSSKEITIKPTVSSFSQQQISRSNTKSAKQTRIPPEVEFWKKHKKEIITMFDPR